MARPLLGDEKRSEVISVRVTKRQKEILEGKFGRAADGLHHLMVVWLMRNDDGDS